MAVNDSMILEIQTLINNSLLEQADDIVGRVGKTAKKSEDAISGMGGAFGKVAAMAATYFSVTKVMEGINLASDFTESRNKLEAVFGGQIEDADNFIKEMASTLNLGTRQLEKEMADVGAMMKGIGFEDVNLNLNTENVLKGAKDIASFYNTDLDSAIKKITGGMAGEAEGLKQLGIMVMDQDMDAYATSLGKSWKEMDNTTKAQLRLNKTLGDLKKAGAYKDAEKTKDEYAAVERSLSSLTETIKGDFFMSVKDALLPSMIDTRDILTNNKDAIIAFGSKIGELVTMFFEAVGVVVTFVSENRALFEVIGEGLLVVGGMITAYKTVMMVTQIWTGIQAAFNAVMLLNPVGLVAAAVVGLGYALYQAYQHFEPFRNIVNSVFDSLKKGWEWLKTSKIGEMFSKLFGGDKDKTLTLDTKETSIQKANEILEKKSTSDTKSENSTNETQEIFKNIAENNVTKVENSHTFDINVNANDSELAAMVERSTRKAAAETIEDYERNKMLTLGLT
ncbi:MAG: hypothetical protein ACRC6U_09260 [Fusobacteriaceae bacterium]